MCNCIAEITERVKEKNNAVSAGMENFGVPYSGVFFVPKRKDGQPGKNRHYTSIPWNFCPFCGEVYPSPQVAG